MKYLYIIFFYLIIKLLLVTYIALDKWPILPKYALFETISLVQLTCGYLFSHIFNNIVCQCAHEIDTKGWKTGWFICRYSIKAVTSLLLMTLRFVFSTFCTMNLKYFELPICRSVINVSAASSVASRVISGTTWRWFLELLEVPVWKSWNYFFIKRYKAVQVDKYLLSLA